MNIFNKLAALLFLNCKKLIQACSEIQQFQERIWIVSIQQRSGQQSKLLNDTFVVSEDSFQCPMQWMKKRGYSVEYIKSIDKMQRSQTLHIQLENSQHSLLRVK